MLPREPQVRLVGATTPRLCLNSSVCRRPSPLVRGLQRVPVRVRLAASGRRVQSHGCLFRVGTCRPLLVEADAGRVSTIGQCLVPRAIANVR